MKKMIISLLTTILLFGLLSCKKDEVAAVSAFSSAPEAQAEHNTKSGGIYKGALIGSSGNIKITLQKGVASILATIDGVSKTLTTTSLGSWTSGQPIKNAVFSSGDWQMTFTVGVDGSNPVATFSIPGHPTMDSILGKESSSAVIRVFEGTYKGSETGTWNIMYQAGTLLGLNRPSNSMSGNHFVGLVDSNMITIDTFIGSGKIDVDKVSGEWQGSTPDVKGTWEGKRTL